MKVVLSFNKAVHLPGHRFDIVAEIEANTGLKKCIQACIWIWQWLLCMHPLFLNLTLKFRNRAQQQGRELKYLWIDIDS